MGRSLQCYILDGLRTLQGRNPQGAPRIPTAIRHQLTSYHFYPVAGAKRKLSQSRWTGLGAGAAGIHNTANGCIQNPHNINIGVKTPLVKILESLENFF